MPDREKVKYDIERCICHVPDACRDCSHYKHGEYLNCMEELLKDALAMLKEQDKRINMKQRRIDQLCKQLTDLKHRFHEKTELVRCKDCVNKKCFGRDGKIVCDLDGFLHKPDWFCADGERKSADEKLMEEMDADPLG